MYLLAVSILLHSVLGTQPKVHNDGNESIHYKLSKNFVTQNQALSTSDKLMSIFNNSKFHLDSTIDPKLPLAKIVLTNLFMSLTSSLPTNASRKLSKCLWYNESAIDTIKLIGESIRDQINVIAQDFRIFGGSRAGQRLLITSKNRNSGNLFEHTIREGYLIVRDIGKIVKEIYSKVKNHFRIFIDSFRRHGYKMMKAERKNNHAENYENILDMIEQFLNVILNIEDCLNSDQRHYNLRAALMKLTGRSSTDSLRLLKNRLDKPLSRFLRTNKTYKQFYALFICHVAVDTFRRDYEKCLQEIERIEKCLDEYDLDQIPPSGSNDWTRSIKYLDSSCTDTKNSDGFYSINCTSERKIPKSVNRQVQLIFKGLSGFELKTSPTLNEVADDLVKILEKSDFGRKSCYRLCQLSMIYQTGQNKRNILEKMVNDDNHDIGEFKNVSQNLHNFRNGILRETIHFVNRLRKCIRSLEKIFSDSVKINMDKSWLEMIQVLDWFFKLFAQVNAQSQSNRATKLIRQKSSVSDPLNDELNDLNNYNIIQLGSSNRSRKVSEERLANFLQSVNNYSVKKWKHQNTALGCIAQSLLLGTLLVEVLACMGSLLYNEEAKQELQFFNGNFRTRRNVPPFLEFLQLEPYFDWNTNDTINSLSKHVRQSHIPRNWKHNTKLSNEVIKFFKTDPGNTSRKSNNK